MRSGLSHQSSQMQPSASPPEKERNALVHSPIFAYIRLPGATKLLFRKDSHLFPSLLSSLPVQGRYKVCNMNSAIQPTLIRPFYHTCQLLQPPPITQNELLGGDNPGYSHLVISRKHSFLRQKLDGNSDHKSLGIYLPYADVRNQRTSGHFLLLSVAGRVSFICIVVSVIFPKSIGSHLNIHPPSS